MVETRSKDYTSKSLVENGDGSSSPGQNSTSTPPSSKPLHIKKQNLDMIIHPPPKGMLHKSTFNPHARATQNYNIVEDLAMSLQPCLLLKCCKLFQHKRNYCYHP